MLLKIVQAYKREKRKPRCLFESRKWDKSHIIQGEW